MGTRSTIAVQHANGKVTSVYCHWDGYLENNGKLLVQHYNTQDLAAELVSGGAISSLGVRITPVGEHSFETPERGTTVYYARDRGEDLKRSDFWDLEMYRLTNDEQEYNYLFRNGEWYLFDAGKPVSTLLAQLEADA